MAKKKLMTREELTTHYLDKAIGGSHTYSVDKIVSEVETIVDCIMRAREADMNCEFYLAVDKELNDE